MITDIIIYNRFRMDTMARGLVDVPFENWALVSIYTEPHEVFVTPEVALAFQKKGCKGIRSLCFWDITEKVYERVLKKYPDATLFNEDQAKEIVNFIKRIHIAPEKLTLVAHCDAGISRSGAVGTFACDFCGLDFKDFEGSNPFIRPNPHVLSLLRRTAGMTPVFGGKIIE